ncbi:PP2C family protein-serine/threonine phosphatase [Collimonas sp.]|uniref:PP2C family protein-serine/threonine phosphatase n=1 Tax=Collimonas sp. TaxID=1963772 RepID=UPI002B84C814|nr:protein phosphatase 2C domain-containing protein [Collimonas sp.]HWW07678.1 protein phosphatase 2C domain-containing protein [Collimonas sp.]
MSQYKIEAGTGQHIGDRQEQQDRAALFTAPKAPGYMMAVLADGMGGRSGGALAAEQVICTAKQIFESFSPLIDNVEAMVRNIALETHTVIKLSGFSNDKDPHTTMVVLVLSPDGTATWGHVGDSRLYRFDGPNFAEHTIDHSYVEKLVSEGKLSRSEAKSHNLSNILLNALGSSTDIPTVSINRHTGLKAGDAFLLCSDGLWHYFTEDELGACIAMNKPRDAAEMLINKTRKRAEGHSADNCTFAIVKLVALPKETQNYTVKKMRRAV